MGIIMSKRHPQCMCPLPDVTTHDQIIQAFPFCICILQVIHDWSWELAGNEARGMIVWYMVDLQAGKIFTKLHKSLLHSLHFPYTVPLHFVIYCWFSTKCYWLPGAGFWFTIYMWHSCYCNSAHTNKELKVIISVEKILVKHSDASWLPYYLTVPCLKNIGNVISRSWALVLFASFSFV